MHDCVYLNMQPSQPIVQDYFTEAGWLAEVDPDITPHLLKFLVLSVHEGLPLLKQLWLGVLNVLQGALCLNASVLHGNDLEKDKNDH